MLLVSRVLKEFQGLVYLGVKQAAFTDLAEDTFEHVILDRFKRKLISSRFMFIV